MTRFDELSQILFEISMSIGTSLDLPQMLRQFASVTLRKLNGTALVVFEHSPCDGQLRFRLVFTLPRRFARTELCSLLERVVPRSLDSDEVASFEAKLPMDMALEDGGCLHLFSLPGYGLIALFRARGALPKEVLYSLAALNQKLAIACKACLAHQDLEEQVKVRTRALENALGDLERSNKELQQFAYVASHDLQEPLRMVSSFLQLLQRKYQGQLDDKADQYIDFAVDGAKRMKVLITDLLELSRIGTTGKPLSATDAGGALAEALSNLQEKIAETGAQVSFDTLPTVMADRTQLVQLMQNLIDNAIKFTRPGAQPEIRVAVQRDEDRWRISIADSGIGIEQQYADRIFLIFQRLHRKQEYAGSGIGLAICRKIIDRHEGTIRMDSAPGEGSTFSFTLADVEGEAQ